MVPRVRGRAVTALQVHLPMVLPSCEEGRQMRISPQSLFTPRVNLPRAPLRSVMSFQSTTSHTRPLQSSATPCHLPPPQDPHAHSACRRPSLLASPLRPAASE
eukprot:911065-Prymnesium_polylepis.1